MNIARGGVLALGLALAASACGGKSARDTSAFIDTIGGSSANNAGSANIGGSSSGGSSAGGSSNRGGDAGASSTDCPSAAPTAGTPCGISDPGKLCFYPVDVCTSTQFECLSG